MTESFSMPSAKKTIEEIKKMREEENKKEFKDMGDSSAANFNGIKNQILRDKNFAPNQENKTEASQDKEKNLGDFMLDVLKEEGISSRDFKEAIKNQSDTYKFVIAEAKKKQEFSKNENQTEGVELDEANKKIRQKVNEMSGFVQKEKDRQVNETEEEKDRQVNEIKKEEEELDKLLEKSRKEIMKITEKQNKLAQEEEKKAEPKESEKVVSDENKVIETNNTKDDKEKRDFREEYYNEMIEKSEQKRKNKIDQSDEEAVVNIGSKNLDPYRSKKEELDINPDEEMYAGDRNPYGNKSEDKKIDQEKENKIVKTSVEAQMIEEKLKENERNDSTAVSKNGDELTKLEEQYDKLDNKEGFIAKEIKDNIEKLNKKSLVMSSAEALMLVENSKKNESLDEDGLEVLEEETKKLFAEYLEQENNVYRAEKDVKGIKRALRVFDFIRRSKNKENPVRKVEEAKALLEEKRQAYENRCQELHDNIIDIQKEKIKKESLNHEYDVAALKLYYITAQTIKNPDNEKEGNSENNSKISLFDYVNGNEKLLLETRKGELDESKRDLLKPFKKLATSYGNWKGNLSKSKRVLFESTKVLGLTVAAGFAWVGLGRRAAAVTVSPYLYKKGDDLLVQRNKKRTKKDFSSVQDAVLEKKENEKINMFDLVRNANESECRRNKNRKYVLIASGIALGATFAGAESILSGDIPDSGGSPYRSVMEDYTPPVEKNGLPSVNMGDGVVMQSDPDIDMSPYYDEPAKLSTASKEIVDTNPKVDNSVIKMVADKVDQDQDIASMEIEDGNAGKTRAESIANKVAEDKNFVNEQIQAESIANKVAEDKNLVDDQNQAESIANKVVEDKNLVDEQIQAESIANKVAEDKNFVAEQNSIVDKINEDKSLVDEQNQAESIANKVAEDKNFVEDQNQAESIANKVAEDKNFVAEQNSIVDKINEDKSLVDEQIQAESIANKVAEDKNFVAEQNSIVDKINEDKSLVDEQIQAEGIANKVAEDKNLVDDQNQAESIANKVAEDKNLVEDQNQAESIANKVAEDKNFVDDQNQAESIANKVAEDKNFVEDQNQNVLDLLNHDFELPENGTVWDSLEDHFDGDRNQVGNILANFRKDMMDDLIDNQGMTSSEADSFVKWRYRHMNPGMEFDLIKGDLEIPEFADEKVVSRFRRS